MLNNAKHGVFLVVWVLTCKSLVDTCGTIRGYSGVHLDTKPDPHFVKWDWEVVIPQKGKEL